MEKLQLFIALLITFVLGGVMLLSVIDFLIDYVSRKTWVKVGKCALGTLSLCAGVTVSSLVINSLVNRDESNITVVETIDASQVSCVSVDMIYAPNDGVFTQPVNIISRDINGDNNSMEFMVEITPRERVSRVKHVIKIPRLVVANQSTDRQPNFEDSS